MYSYHLIQWLLFLYIYCFLGWVWESSYVSIVNKKWVNRGFMHGPYLPIYGFGAITVLLTTIPVKNNLVLVFLFGMIGATILEYVTGAVMEHLFHVRYWDYSKQKFNLNGYICLSSSLAWGAFSILMIKVIHCPIEAFVLKIPYEIAEIIVFSLTVVIAVDFTQSFNEAMDLKEILENLTESNEEFKRIRKRVDVVIAVIDGERKELAIKVSEGKQTIEDKVNEIKEKYEQHKDLVLQESDSKKHKLSHSFIIHTNLSKKREDRSISLARLSERLNEYLESIRSVEKDQPSEDITKIKNELEEFKDSIKKLTSRLHVNNDKSYHRGLNMLRRNPNAVSKQYSDALKEVKELDRRNEDMK